MIDRTEEIRTRFIEKFPGPKPKRNGKDYGGLLEYAKASDRHDERWQGYLAASLEHSVDQPRLTVRLLSFPESNGKRNWTALLTRVDEWDELVGNCGGVTIARGEYWNRVAYAAQEVRLLIGERNVAPDLLDYGYDIETPEEWAGESQLDELEIKTP